MLVTISKRFFLIGFSILLIMLIVTADTWSPALTLENIRQYSKPYEFDFVNWEISTIWEKIIDLSFGISHHLTNRQQKTIIEDYFQLLARARKIEQQITELYADPVSEQYKKITTLENEFNNITIQLKHQKKLAEAVLQYQISQAITELGIAHIETPAPPILFHTTPLPKQLIISPRDVIRQEESISLIADISLSEMIALENVIEENTDYSALVVPIGGISTYPSMIVQTSYLPNLLDTAAHEWIHNYLFFRPLGLRYSVTPALRTMNETTASISGNEIMQTVIDLFYPEYLRTIQPSDAILNADFLQVDLLEEDIFDFSKEMYTTRNQVDEMLAEGKIEEAEIYMEERRAILWENGYQIRKLNQAYFSFYGAYADSPFSAAGSDPVGEDVRLFRSQQPDLETFISKISWMYNYRQLRNAARAF